MNITREMAEKAANEVSIDDIKKMLRLAYKKKKNWNTRSRVNPIFSFGKTFNMYVKCTLSEDTHILARINMIRDFGDYLNHIQKQIKQKEQLVLYHEEPIGCDI